MEKIWHKRLEDYRKGKLNPKEMQEVAEKLAMLEAMQDYLWENESLEIPDLPLEKNIDANKIKGQVRKKFLYLGSGVFITLLAIALLIFFVVLPFAESRYYNPQQERISQGVSDYQISQTLYTELTNPNYTLVNSDITKLGFAQYQILNHYAPKFAVLNKGSQTVTTMIEKSKNQAASQDAQVLIGSQFLRPDLPGILNQDTEELSQHLKNKALTKLAELPKSSSVSGVLTFRKSLTIDEALAFYQKNENKTQSESQLLWLAIQTSSNPQNSLFLGIDLEGTKELVNYQNHLKELNQDYPSLFPWIASNKPSKPYDGKVYTQHFLSVLQYFIDHSETLRTLNDSFTVNDLQAVKEYVAKNGLQVTGMYLSGNSQKFSQYAAEPEVWSIGVMDTELYGAFYQSE